MKKVIVMLLVIVIIVGAFILGNKMNIDNNVKTTDSIETSLQTTENNTIDINTTSKVETTTAKKVIDKVLTREDFYLYKETINDGEGVYIYRQDGQVSVIYNGDEIESEFSYDEDGLLQHVWDMYWGEAYFQYEYFNGKYIGTGVYEGRDTLWRYTYDDNFLLLKREGLSDSNEQIYEILYDENNNIVKTIEYDWTTTVKNFNKKGVLLREEEFGDDNELLYYADYDNEGILKKTEHISEGEIYKYSEVKKEDGLYVEYIYRNGFTDSYYEKNNLPIGSYVLYYKVERKYNEYGNIILEEGKFVDETTSDETTDYIINYEYKLKSNIS